MTHASVFSGIGGSEVAAAMLGWENLFHCEINDFGRTVLDYWFPNSKSYEDITKTDFSSWHGQIDVLTGGFPCQPFSYAGKRRGEEDDRYLWPHMHRAINEINPTWIVAENVVGITTMVEQGEVSEVASEATMFNTLNDVSRRYELRETFTIERICSDIEADGYEVQTVLIPACAVGAPHRRDRVFIVGRRQKAITDTDSLGRSVCRSKTFERENNNIQTSIFGMSERFGKGKQVADTETEFADETETNDEEKIWWNTANAYFDRLERYIWPRISVEKEERISAEELADRYRNLWPGRRWKNFPIVSPVHRGNDGVPFPLDCLTISPGKWRTEALKAYGNAIVPQVMFEIFRTIEQTEQSLKTSSTKQ